MHNEFVGFDAMGYNDGRGIEKGLANFMKRRSISQMAAWRLHFQRQ